MSGGEPARERHVGVPRAHEALCYALSAAGGLLAWSVTAAASHHVEAWDGPGYFSVAYPLLAVVCVACGWFARRRPWRWGLTAMAVQFVAMLLKSGAGPLWPIGTGLMLAMSAPLTLAGALGGWLHGRASARGG